MTEAGLVLSSAKELWHEVQVRQFDAGGSIIPVNTDFIDAVRSTVHGVNTTSVNNNCANRDFSRAWKSS